MAGKKQEIVVQEVQPSTKSIFASLIREARERTSDITEVGSLQNFVSELKRELPGEWTAVMRRSKETENGYILLQHTESEQVVILPVSKNCLEKTETLRDITVGKTPDGAFIAYNRDMNTVLKGIF